MTRTLFIIHSNTFFVELFRLAKLLKSSENYEPVVFFSYRYPTYFDDILRCLENQIPCFDINGRQITDIGESGYSEKVLSFGKNGKSRLGVPPRILSLLKVLYWKGNTFFRRISLVRLAQEYKYFQDRLKFIRYLIRDQNPGLIVLGGDMVGYDTSIYIQVAHQRKTPVAIVPSTMSNGLEQAEAYFHNPNYNLGSCINRIAARLYPKWVREHRGRNLLRVPGERVLIMEYFNLTPPLPWIFNSGFADAIAIESEQMKKYYMDCGLPEGQLILTGSLADDVMADTLRRKEQIRVGLCTELGLDQKKPILLSALPPDFLYMEGGRPECDFGVYSELVKFWVESIAKVENYNIVFCLHPSVKFEDFRYIENWGVKIARRGTADLIPLCDIYVASVSSTIRWALACGIPVINYDVYRYQYTDFLDAVGVLTMKERVDFEATLAKLTKDADYYNWVKLRQQSAASQWGLLDGQVSTRIQNLFDSLVGLHNEGKQKT